MLLELVILALTILIAPLGGYVAGARYRGWSRRRAVMLGALALPVILMALAVLLLIIALMKPNGWETALALTSAGVGIVVYLVSLPLATVGVLLARRVARQPNVGSEFE